MVSCKEALEISGLISLGTASTSVREDTIKARKKVLRATCLYEQGFTKSAFDTRRIDQEETFNPRRGLQYYHRSAEFVPDDTESKLKKLLKLHTVLCELKQEYGKEFEWHDSNARILLGTLDSGLRIKQGDGDFSESQPSQGGLNYIEELLYVRYKLGYDEIENLSEAGLKKVILSRDEALTKQAIYNSPIYSKSVKPEIVKSAPNDLLQQLFGNVKATAENPSVERTITITIKDKLMED